jgi:hypothetical protein
MVSYHAPLSLHETEKALTSVGINRGWGEFFLELGHRGEERVADMDEYCSYMSGAEERLMTQSLPTDPIPEIEPIRGMEVGDDRKDESLSPTGLAIGLTVQSAVFKMKTSESDTFISRDRSNFCEVTTITPRSVEGSFHTARKRNDLSNLEFIDVCPFRLIEPVAKGKGTDHSSSKSGKASLAGPKQSFCRPELQEDMYLMNLLQDGSLLTSRSPEPKYLPTLLGGSGAPALFNNAENQFLYMLSYKGGGYSRVYGTAVNEVRNTLYNMELNNGYVCPWLTLKLRDKQEYLYGTYAEKVFVPTAEMKSQLKATLPPPIYMAGGTTNDLSSVEARLIAAKVLITRTQAEVEFERTLRNGSVLFGNYTNNYQKTISKRDSTLARKAFDGALAANSALHNLLKRQANGYDVSVMLKDPSFNVVLTGAREYTRSHARWIHEGCKSDTYTLRDIFKPADMFLRSEVSTEEEMKISGIGRLWLRNGKNVITETRAEVGLWQVSNDMQEWAQSLGLKLAGKRDSLGVASIPRRDVRSLYFENRENVADDPLILEHVARLAEGYTPTERGVVFTQDVSLVKSIANRTGMSFYRMSPELLLRVIPGKEVRDECMAYENPTLVWEKFFRHEKNFSGHPIRISVVDQGSLDATLVRHAKNPDLPGKGNSLFHVERTEMGYLPHQRFETHSYQPMERDSARPLQGSGCGIDGRPLVDLIAPSKRVRTKLPKFESYRSGDSSASTSSAGSHPHKRRSKPSLASETTYY